MYKKITVITEYCKVPEDVTLEDLLNSDSWNNTYNNVYDTKTAPTEYPIWQEPEGAMFKKPLKFKKAMKLKRQALKAAKAANVFTTISNENTDAGVTLRMQTREFFTRYNNLVRDYIVSKTNKTPDFDRIKTALMDHEKGISSIFLTWYRNENTPATVNAFDDLTKAIVDAIDSKVANGDISPAAERYTNAVNAFATSLNNLSLPPGQALIGPPMWPETGVKDIFANYMNSVIRQIDARKTNDWDGDQTAARLAYSILAVGLPTGMASFADVLSKGMINQSPWRFAN